jgi:hypothetical protein
MAQTQFIALRILHSKMVAGIQRSDDCYRISENELDIQWSDL